MVGVWVGSMKLKCANVRNSRTAISALVPGWRSRITAVDSRAARLKSVSYSWPPVIGQRPQERIDWRGGRTNLICWLRINDSVSIVTNDVVASRLESAYTCEVRSSGSTVKRYDTAVCSCRPSSINPTTESRIT